MARYFAEIVLRQVYDDGIENPFHQIKTYIQKKPYMGMLWKGRGPTEAFLALTGGRRRSTDTRGHTHAEYQIRPSHGSTCGNRVSLWQHKGTKSSIVA